jgi:hypothetical protein
MWRFLCQRLLVAAGAVAVLLSAWLCRPFRGAREPTLVRMTALHAMGHKHVMSLHVEGRRTGLTDAC